jgi:hypothetical protein
MMQFFLLRASLHAPFSIAGAILKEGVVLPMLQIRLQKESSKMTLMFCSVSSCIASVETYPCQQLQFARMEFE